MASRTSGLRSLLERFALNGFREKAVRTARRLLAKVRFLKAEKAAVESVLRTAMDPSVAESIAHGSLRNRKAVITVLFSDLEGFTSHSEGKAPESVIEVLNRLYSSIEPVLQRYHGHLDKFVGDGMMAEFGLARGTAQHAVLAVLAALRMQEKLRALDFPWRMRIGIASGPCIMGLVGSESRKNYTAIGDTVNLAARLQAICPAGSVCVDSETYRRVRHWFRFRRIRHGLSPEEARELEAKLGSLTRSLESEPDVERFLEAADLAADLGETELAVRLHKKALALAPESRASIEQGIGSAFLKGEERGALSVKGKRRKVEAYEVLGLLDPLRDEARVPRRAEAIFRELSSRVRLPEEAIEPFEALDGALGHSRLTAALSAAVAEAMGLGEAETQDVFLAAYLHDIGKRLLPARLLGCEDRMEDLSEDDRKTLLSHAVLGTPAMEELGIQAGASVRGAVAQHHELYDGSGYPEGLRGAGISLGARILQVAEIYESLTSWRPYREAWERDSALAEIRRSVTGGKLDPAAGETFLRLLEGA